ncbi:ATP-binding protein [Acidaminobacter sp. JC074]|nr:ATP-binding protein [Acidaminobacter sp. JC074]
MIKRTQYINEVKQVMDKHVIKVLLGMRRVGKSTLLIQIQDELIKKGVSKDQIISINLEWLEHEELKDYMKLHQYISEKMVTDNTYYIFLDEIQEVNQFEKVINSLHSKGHTDIYITGSNSKLLSGELATYLTGRLYTIEIYPLSLNEIYNHRPSNHEFIDYIKSGGLPGSLQFDSERTRKNYIMDMYQSILLKDIVERYHVKNIDLFKRFMQYLLNNIGQTFSAGTITKYLKNEGRKLSRETIYQYIEAAKNSYLIYSVSRFNVKGKEVLRANEKYYINDLGIRQLYFNNEKDIGQALENIVFIELKRRGYTIEVGKYDDKEIDFIASDGSSTMYIQVTYLLASDSTIKREFSVLEAIEDNFPKFVISMDEVNHSRNGIIHKNIIEFLYEKRD